VPLLLPRIFPLSTGEEDGIRTCELKPENAANETLPVMIGVLGGDLAIVGMDEAGKMGLEAQEGNVLEIDSWKQDTLSLETTL